MSSFSLSGLWVPVITPFHQDASLDLKSLERVCRSVLSNGARGIVALGTTGEPATLEDAERQLVVDTCSQVCVDHGKPLIVGIGTNSTRATVNAALALANTPALAAVLVVVPYYTRPSAAGIIEHFASVASQSPVPVVAYNVPYRTGATLSIETQLAIARTPNILGVKQSVGALDVDTLQLIAEAPASFQVLAGDDAFIGPTILQGGVGAISAASHMCTSMFADLVEASSASADAVTTRALTARLLPLVRAGFSEPSPAVWKAALHAQGVIDSATVRAPMSSASHEATTRLITAVSAAEAQRASR